MKRFLALFCALTLSGPALAEILGGTDPAQSQAIMELLARMKYREQLTSRLQQAAQAMPQSMLKAQTERINANTRLSDEQKKAELAIVANDVQRVGQEGQRLLADQKFVDDILERIVPLFARQFTPAEINELLAFYKSPTATKMQALMPQVIQETNQLVQEELRQRLMAAVRQGASRK